VAPKKKRIAYLSSETVKKKQLAQFGQSSARINWKRGLRCLIWRAGRADGLVPIFLVAFFNLEGARRARVFPSGFQTIRGRRTYEPRSEHLGGQQKTTGGGKEAILQFPAPKEYKKAYY